MPNKLFLEEHPLFKNFFHEFHSSSHEWSKPAINMNCVECQSPQTFLMAPGFYYEIIFDDFNSNHYALAATVTHDGVFDLTYLCQSCRSYTRKFSIYVNVVDGYCMKYGQFPGWEIKVDKNLEDILGEFIGNYKKGLVCESQGYGIGAFAYYRRIAEEIIDQLLDSIQDLIPEVDKVRYVEALKMTKTTRVTQDKINLVKDLLPPILRPNGSNPLGILHSELSAGLHGESDEECLERAHHVRHILTFLVNQILISKQASQQFTSSMRALLDKKAKLD